MEAFLGKVLQQHLGHILLDFNAKKNSKFKFSLGSGQKCVLKDLKLDPEFLSKLMPGIPFLVESGVIDQITVHAKLHSVKTQATLVEVGTVEIVIKELPQLPADVNGMMSKSKTGSSSSHSLGAVADESARGAGSNVKESSSGEGTYTKDCTNQTMETPAGVLRKRVKKHSNLAAKIGAGIHWKVRELRVTLRTAGEMKTNNSLAEPPALNIVIRDLDFYSTDEHGNKCDLKRARAYGKHFEDKDYSFKRGSCFLSVSLTPANPWFPDVVIIEAAEAKINYVSVFEAMWQNSKGEDVTVEIARSFDIVCEEPLLCHLNGDDILHVGECLKGLYLAMYRETPYNAYTYGVCNIPKQIINISVPEIVLSAMLDGPGDVQNATRKGLALKLRGLKMGVISGPKDFESTTQVEIASISLVDLADPLRIFVSAPWKLGSDPGSPASPASIPDSMRVKAIDWCTIHPLHMDKQHVESLSTRARTPPQKFLRLEWTSCNPMWSSFRPPDSVLELHMILSLDGLHLVMDQNLLDYAMCIQTLVAMNRALSAIPFPDVPSKGVPASHAPTEPEKAARAGSQGEGLAGAYPESDEDVLVSVSWLEIRSRVEIKLIDPMIQVKLPPSVRESGAEQEAQDAAEAAAEDEHTVALYFDGIYFRADGKNAADKSTNCVSFEASVNRGGLYCDDVAFAASAGAPRNVAAASEEIPATSPVLGPDTYSLGEIHQVTGTGTLVVECAAVPRRGVGVEVGEGDEVDVIEATRIREMVLDLGAAHVAISIQSRHPQRLLRGLSDRYNLVTLWTQSQAQIPPAAAADRFASVTSGALADKQHLVSLPGACSSGLSVLVVSAMSTMMIMMMMIMSMMIAPIASYSLSVLCSAILSVFVPNSWCVMCAYLFGVRGMCFWGSGTTVWRSPYKSSWLTLLRLQQLSGGPHVAPGTGPAVSMRVAVAKAKVLVAADGIRSSLSLPNQ